MKQLLLIFLLCTSYGVVIAQQSITGKVTSGMDGEALPGVSIVVEGTTIGTTTDVDGNFQLSVPEDAEILVFSFIGYETRREQINNQSVFDIVLSEDIQSLEEIVVVGYGTQKRSAVTGSISSLDNEELLNTPALQVEQALQGKVAGVQVTNLSGQPGDAPTIRIRGVGTNGNSNPIYIVDGFQVGGIEYLNPGDIERVDILKDAASAAIYGARAANGVVLITTKSGKKGQATTVDYNAYYGVQNAWKKLDLLNAQEYAVMMNEGAVNGGSTPLYSDLSELPYDTDWQEELFNDNAPIMNHQISIAAGNEISSMNASMSYFSQEGIVGGDKSQFDRITARINSTHDISDRFTFGENISYTHFKRRSINPNEEFGGLISNALNMDPLTPVYISDPDILASSPYVNQPVVRQGGNVFGISNNIGQEIVNPLARLELANGRYRQDKLVGNVFGEYEILEGLKFRTLFGLDLAYENNDDYVPLFYLNAAQSNLTEARVTKNFTRHSTWNSENTLQYEREFDKHSLNVIIGTTMREYKREHMTGTKDELVIDDAEKVNFAFSAAQTGILGGDVYEEGLVSYFGRIMYNYQEKYFLTGIIRRDGSTMFGPENRFGTFPSVSAGWVFTREEFFPNLNFINFGKLRASWGINGNDRIQAWQYLSSIGIGRGYTFREDGEEVFVNGAAPLIIADPGVKWEESVQLDLGLDLTLFDNKLTFNADYYRKETEGLLAVRPSPRILGNVLGVQNIGSVLNSGLELALNYSDQVGDFSYSLGTNFTYNKNEVTEVNGAGGVLTGASFSTYGGTITRMEVGLPMAYFYGYKTNGIFQNQAEVEAYTHEEGGLIQPDAVPGDVRFVDVNGDGAIDDDDKTNIGNPYPDWVYGFNGSVNYKGFTLSFLFNGVIGNQIFNGIRRHDLNTANMPAYYLDRWTGEGTSNTMPRYTWEDKNGNYTNISDLYLESGSFLRLRNIQLGYDLAQRFLGPLQRVHLYVSAENLITVTDYQGLDPEIGSRLNNGVQNVFDIGIDRGVYPQPRTFRIGIDVTF